MRDRFQFVEIVRQICRIEFAFDFSVATKEAAVRNVVPFRDQMRGDEHCLAALRFEAKRLLQSFAPGRIETQARFVEQQDRRVGQKQQGQAEPLTRAAGKLAESESFRNRAVRLDRAWLRNARPRHRATARRNA